jgi:predicted transcriptional regulator
MSRESSVSAPQLTYRDRILELIRRKPGLTEVEIAREIFANPYRERVNPTCRALVQEGLVKRSGRGGRGTPFTYSPTDCT